MATIGRGLPAYPFAPAGGRLRSFRSPSDVIDAIDSDLGSTIALVDSGGTTFLSPILGRLAGVVCRGGTLRSHLAIVSREFEVPCVLGAQLPELLPDGTSVLLDVVDGQALVRTGTKPAAEVPAGADRRTRSVAGAAAPVAVPRRAGPTEPADVVARWWDYVRRPGDEIGVKDFDLVVSAAALRRLIAEPLDDNRLDDLIGHMGRAFKPEMTRRSGFTSELFPMLPYMALSVIEDFHSYPARVAAIDAVMPAEEIGRRLRGAPGLVSPLWIWMVGYHYLSGRECLIKMGRLRPNERIEDVRTVVDFWRRLTLAHRGDGTLDYKDAGFTNRYLPAGVVDDLAGAATPVSPARARALKRLNATASGYTFLYFCESRVGVCDGGPYPLADGRQLLVRDFLSLGPSAWDYPWARELRPPYQGLTLALVFDPAAFTSFEINDWGTTFTEPDQLLGAVTEAAVFGHRPDGTGRLLPADEWEEPVVELGHAHVELYRRFIAMDRRERIFAATRMYTSGLRPFAEVAGASSAVDWSLSPDTLALYPDPLDDDERAAEIFGGALVANDLPGAFSPIR
ncbi:MAG TPA: PEP-utilizing enzyme [Pseudonocardia sp.]|jgi:phosphohistidine swiveling domain-containing protein